MGRIERRCAAEIAKRAILAQPLAASRQGVATGRSAQTGDARGEPRPKFLDPPGRCHAAQTTRRGDFIRCQAHVLRPRPESRLDHRRKTDVGRQRLARANRNAARNRNAGRRQMLGRLLLVGRQRHDRRRWPQQAAPRFLDQTTTGIQQLVEFRSNDNNPIDFARPVGQTVQLLRRRLDRQFATTGQRAGPRDDRPSRSSRPPRRGKIGGQCRQHRGPLAAQRIAGRGILPAKESPPLDTHS